MENLIEHFGEADFSGECTYLFKAMNFIGKAQVWPQISDKKLIGKELAALNKVAQSSASLPSLFKFMARYLTLPVGIGDNVFTRPFYLSFINRSYNRISGS